MSLGPLVKWPGSKWNLADWIISRFPPHRHYCEPFFGSGAVFFNKSRSEREYLNDRSGNIVNLFRMVRDRHENPCRVVELTPWAREEYEACVTNCAEGDEIERARRFLVACWQAVGVCDRSAQGSGWRTLRLTHVDPAMQWVRLPARIACSVERLRGVNIECRPALDVIRRYANPDVLLYCDPPYPLDTRHGALYAHEMTDEDHVELLQMLEKHPGPVLVSGYRCGIYDEALGHWKRYDAPLRDQVAAVRTESLWLNTVASKRLDGMHPSLFSFADDHGSEFVR